jgi:CelD/BcsL family acetyltransferase involved in cellulose biosynthesis
MVEIQSFRQETEFLELASAWNQLLSLSTQNNPFLTHQWLRAWWEAFGNGAELHILLFYDIRTETKPLIGIFPGYIRSTGFFPPIRALRLLGSEVVDSDFLDVITAPGRENDVLAALCAYIRENKEFHVTELTDIPDCSHTVKLFHHGRVDNLNVTDWRARKICPHIDLPEDPARYFSGLSQNTRKKYRYRRQLEARGMGLEIIRDTADLPEALTDFTRMHTGRRRQKGQAGIFATERQRGFYESVFRRFLEAGWLELAFLRVGSERVAAVCQFSYGDGVYYYQAGYDTAWEKSRVGFVLLCLLIEKAIREKKKRYELLRGEERYKYGFGVTGETKLVDLSVHNGCAAGGLAVSGRKIGRGARAFLKSALPDAMVDVIRMLSR